MTTTRTRRAALAAALLCGVAGLTACGDDATVSSPTPASTVTASPSATATPGATTAATPGATASATAPATTTTTRAVAVYYLTGDEARLYREFHRRPVTDAVVRDAVTAMLTDPAQDASYTSMWPRGTRVLGVRKDGTTLVVDLSEEATSMAVGAAFESASLQQLVWTATAADPTATAVQLLVEGRRVESLAGHVDSSEPMRRSQAAEVLGPVWVLTPTDGGTLRRGARFGGEASVFEATVSWQLLRAGTVVDEGFVTASEGAPGRGTWSAVVDVPPGDYLLRAFESSAEDGRDTFVDDKRVTVV